MPDFTTWTALLAHWTDMARLARAIDGTGDGPRSQLLPHVITCQSLAHALPDVMDLPTDQRSMAMDRAAILLMQVEQAAEDDFTMPPPVLVAARIDAQQALDDLHLSCCWTLIWEGPEPLIVPDVPNGVPARGEGGTLLLALPGTVLLPGTPVGWWQGRLEPMLGHFVPGMLAQPHLTGVQVWRTVDAHGTWVRDEVHNCNADGPDDATPLLAPRVVDGQRLRMPTPTSGWIGASTPPPGGVPINWIQD